MQKKIEIVVIEDEEDILELIEYHLQKDAYHTTGFLNTQNVEQFLAEEEPSLMIIDRNLPQVEGSDFVKYIRKLGYDLPVIFLTAKAKESDLERGFEVGADDYITKPFSPKELRLRVKALLRRAGVLDTSVQLVHRDLVLDLKEYTFEVAGETVPLTHLEFKLIHTFIKHSQEALTRDFLRDEVWGNDKEGVNDNSVNVAINRLKNKIDPQNQAQYFVPVWGVGYKLN